MGMTVDSTISSKKRVNLVTTIPDRCRVCYTCVRECPARAIRIIAGQAEVIGDRCIGCGNCIKVCSQGAKTYVNYVEEVSSFLAKDKPVAALIAPSFPAEFSEIGDYQVLVGMIRSLGFSQVCEVAFGADLVARAYSEVIGDAGHLPVISSDCPAIVSYITHYHPALVGSLAEIASPMVAMTRVVKERYGNETGIVFIGPCVSKKSESDEVDFVITFQELRELFQRSGIVPDGCSGSEFDPPIARRGAIFPVKRGMLQTLNIPEDLFEGNILVAEGRVNFAAAIAEFEKGSIADQHLELLCCEGCIMGPGMSQGGQRYARRAMIGQYARKKVERHDLIVWQAEMENYKSLDLSSSYHADDRRLPDPDPEVIRKVLSAMGKTEERDHLNCGDCGYDSCISHAIAIAQGLAEQDMCLPFTIDKMHQSIVQLNFSNEKLASVQQALKHSVKLANMGQLSAGIAHELNNPLGVVMLYANLLHDECVDERMKEDLRLIVSQADRCRKIVGNLLNFARKNQVNLATYDLLQLAEESLASVIIPPVVKTRIVNKLNQVEAKFDREQMTQVLTNLIKNAADAMPNGGELIITLDRNSSMIAIDVEDTGTGISPDNRNKLFTPFFTTKEIGKGTGLGLATVYGIIKMHKGKIDVESNDDPAAGRTGTRFKIHIPQENL